MNKRQYGIFEKQEGKFVRIFPNLNFTKEIAVRMFQTQLLAPYMNGIDGVTIKGIRELKPLKPLK